MQKVSELNEAEDMRNDQNQVKTLNSDKDSDLNENDNLKVTSENYALIKFKTLCKDIIERISKFSCGILGYNEINSVKEIKDELLEAITITFYDEKGSFKDSLCKNRTDVESSIIILSKMTYHLITSTQKPVIAVYCGPEHDLSNNLVICTNTSYIIMTKILETYYMTHQNYNDNPKNMILIWKSTFNRFIDYIMRITKETQINTRCFDLNVAECSSVETYRTRYSGVSDMILSHLFFLTLDEKQRMSNDFNSDDIEKYALVRIKRLLGDIVFKVRHKIKSEYCVCVPLLHDDNEIYDNIDTWLKEDLGIVSTMQKSNYQQVETEKSV